MYQAQGVWAGVSQDGGWTLFLLAVWSVAGLGVTSERNKACIISLSCSGLVKAMFISLVCSGIFPFKTRMNALLIQNYYSTKIKNLVVEKSHAQQMFLLVMS